MDCMSAKDNETDFEDLDRDRTLDELEDTDVDPGELARIDSEKDLEISEQEFGGLDSAVDRDDEELTEAGIDEREDQADDYLDDSGESDDLPWTPPESRPINAEIGLDAQQEDQEETIDQRIEQEEPEAGTAYGKPESPSDERRQSYHEGDPDDVDLNESAEQAAMHIEE